jgi:hypothetical protein
LSFAGINTQVNRIKADGQLARNLPRAPLQLQQQLRLIIHRSWHCIGIAAALRSIGRHITSLLGAVAPRASVAAQLPTDCGLLPIQHLSNLSMVKYGSDESVNLITFSLAEVFVPDNQLRMQCHNTLTDKIKSHE